jgi:L-threonylcarbamoyladenylate synthase
MNVFEEDIGHCLVVLQQGGIILYPTDTVWGIGCDATNENAVKKIFSIKGRSTEKSMIVLVADEKDILKYVASPDPAVFDFIKGTTKPTSIIYDGAIGLAANLIHHDGSIAIRVVQEKFCCHLIKRFRKPIVSTSANFSGDPAPRNFRGVFNDIRTAVDYVAAYRQDEQEFAESSSVIKWNRDGSTTIIRP